MKKIFIAILILSSISCKRNVADAFVGEWKVYTVSGKKIDDFQTQKEQELKDMYKNYTLKITRDGVNYLVVEKGGLSSFAANLAKDNVMMLKEMTEHHCLLFEQTNTLVGGSAGSEAFVLNYSPENDEIIAGLWLQALVFKRK